MNLFIEIIIEFILSIFTDNTDNIIENKKISKWIRYPTIFLLIVFSLALTVGPIVLGVVIFNKSVIVSIASILIGLIFLISIVFKVKKTIKKRANG